MSSVLAPSSVSDPVPALELGRFRYSRDRPLVMAIINVTPDSFSDGGRYLDPQAAIDHARAAVSEGADILDIGAESTRPGAPAVSPQEQIDRLAPVIDALVDCGVAVSIDTRKVEVMCYVLARGVDLINDVAGFADPAARAVVAASSAGVCAMHMQGEPATMQHLPKYRDVVHDVVTTLRERRDALVAAGVAARRIVLDPGIGFGKTATHNIALLRGLRQLVDLGQPVLVGVSRKSLIGELTGRPVDQRLAGSVAGALAAVAAGASIVRVHDVAATRDALKVWTALAPT